MYALILKNEDNKMKLFIKLIWATISYSIGTQFIMLLLGISYDPMYMNVYMLTYWAQFIFTGINGAMNAASNTWGKANERLGASSDIHSRRMTTELLAFIFNIAALVGLVATINLWAPELHIDEVYWEAMIAMLVILATANSTFSTTVNMCYEGNEHGASRLAMIFNAGLLAIVPLSKILGLSGSQALLALIVIPLIATCGIKAIRLRGYNNTWHIDLPHRDVIKFMLAPCYSDVGMIIIYIATVYKIGVQTTNTSLITMAIVVLSADILWDSHGSIGSYYNLVSANNEHERVHKSMIAVTSLNIVAVIVSASGFFLLSMLTQSTPDIMLVITSCISLVIYGYTSLMREKLIINGGVKVVSMSILSTYAVRIGATILWINPYSSEYILVVTGAMYLAIYGIALLKREKKVGISDGTMQNNVR